MKKGTIVIVSDEAPFHAGEKGKFEFYGTQASAGTAVLSELNSNGDVLFAVSANHISPLFSHET